ncbi:hypothetical protein [Leeuwenhoekiella marinoflava]|uniref:Membrane metalloprotease n=2 Tax=Leeuwenhoekiella marinoflava TaxID=988 RepID=A0A4Q0PIQ9_9FLAO|nr:hypothetical protein [Leeuwenhoekiella marinoflava]RXG27048.1 hypothetical protein DSL99_3102 [Leeuwenhoekiella marinoflava]SHF42935.1 hypothetical protein SAMN02745246_02497 [Leeuwenhoekiella marinoflava DSM 3653]
MTLNKITPYLTILFTSLILSCSSDNDSAATTTTDPTLANKKALGASARDFLSAEQFTSMNVEIAYVEGFRPSNTTLSNLRNLFSQRLNKPDGVIFTETVVPASTVGALNRDEYTKIEEDNRTVFNVGDELGVWVFFTNENSESDEGNSRILGTAYRNTSCIIFGETLRDFSRGITGPSLTQLETVTTEHEFGHLFGLVNLGTPMVRDHEDETADDDGEETPNKHCNQDNCLMYFQTVADATSTTMNGLPTFGEFCQEDLRANGGK